MKRLFVIAVVRFRFLQLLSVTMACFLATATLVTVAGRAVAAPVYIVALGDSQTAGTGLTGGRSYAYPALLESMLRSRGYDAHVANAGVPGEGAAQMLLRVDRDVPNGTQLVLFNPGFANDIRHGLTQAQHDQYAQQIRSRLEARGIRVLFIGKQVGALHDTPAYHLNDAPFFHLNEAGHSAMASWLFPQVVNLIGPPR